ncbi:hypothetical protein CEXT_737331 [Caerostris extrusa]|uniref:Uncharacterized protein n=1 Tax=Caerostris extrusa TaxID=172846 RepID=A0AAV4WSZ3_CAEEX|nr:hypothetical protein CEXT_737331 [Caerostris extrusa]
MLTCPNQHRNWLAKLPLRDLSKKRLDSAVKYIKVTFTFLEMNFLQINSYKTATYMTVAVAIVGLALLIGGAALTGIAYTEVRPNYADENYNRYMGAHLQRTVGPIMLAFGGLLLFGAASFWASSCSPPSTLPNPPPSPASPEGTSTEDAHLYVQVR